MHNAVSHRYTITLFNSGGTFDIEIASCSCDVGSHGSAMGDPEARPIHVLEPHAPLVSLASGMDLTVCSNGFGVKVRDR